MRFCLIFLTHYGRDAIFRVRHKWLLTNKLLPLWVGAKYHVYTVLCYDTTFCGLPSMKAFLTSSSCHPIIFVEEFSDFLLPCH